MLGSVLKVVTSKSLDPHTEVFHYFSHRSAFSASKVPVYLCEKVKKC